MFGLREGEHHAWTLSPLGGGQEEGFRGTASWLTACRGVRVAERPLGTPHSLSPCTNGAGRVKVPGCSPRRAPVSLHVGTWVELSRAVGLQPSSSMQQAQHRPRLPWSILSHPHSQQQQEDSPIPPTARGCWAPGPGAGRRRRWQRWNRASHQHLMFTARSSGCDLSKTRRPGSPGRAAGRRRRPQ